MVKFERTKRITEALYHMSECSRLVPAERERWSNICNNFDHELTHQGLVSISEHLRTCKDWHGEFKWVHELVQGAEPIIHQPQHELLEEYKEREIRVKKRLIEIKEREEEIRYQKMTRGLLSDGKYGMGLTFKEGYDQPQTVAAEMKELSHNIFFAVNLIIAMAVSFLIGFYFGKRMRDQEFGYIVGTGAMIITLVIEAVLIVIRVTHQEEYEEKQRLKRQKLATRRKIVKPNLAPIPIPGNGHQETTFLEHPLAASSSSSSSKDAKKSKKND